ncbi:MAG: 3-phosphoserine/phosphohydroxythreonine transaminase [Clostridia bacterium]|nr:3-phosphoserine/phosphohydroxythreonine transaminase [Clostridia bacterium]
MSRVFNFSAGPSMLPVPVLEKAAAEILDYNGSGQSVMEMSHRSAVFEEILHTTQALFAEVMGLPSNYKVLFFQGGATAQFAAIPLCFMQKNNKADFIITGQWAKKAYQEAGKYGAARAVASSADKTFSYIPKTKPEDFDPDADYAYICMNNTIYGTHYNTLPDTGKVPLIADISSCFLSEELDVTKFALVYGGAQKNVAPAGVTVCIVREDFIGPENPLTPVILSYKTNLDNDSMYNTPPCWNIYMCKLMLEWIRDNGGLKGIHEMNLRKANLFYDYLDSSEMFSGTVVKEDRSLMNIPFVTGDPELDKKFVAEATAAGFVNLKGHRTVGGMRASIYNAMPYEGVAGLVEFMKDFEKRQ